LGQKKTQQVKAYRLGIAQTSPNGTFLCPRCGAKISPDDRSENTYTIYDTIMKDNNLDEVIIYCKRCLSFIHLYGLSDTKSHAETMNQGTAVYASHI
jgi:predicted RNA-binding Zn-ribbon protein involved in translation (DUF1610 family)